LTYVAVVVFVGVVVFVVFAIVLAAVVPLHDTYPTEQLKAMSIGGNAGHVPVQLKDPANTDTPIGPGTSNELTTPKPITLY
jgi:hypothetical protein